MRASRGLREASVVLLLLSPPLGCKTAGDKGEPGYVTLPGGEERRSDEATRLNREAAALIGKRKWSDAEEVLKRALAADVLCGPAHNNLGKVYFHQDKFYLAAWEFQYAAKLMPGRAEPRNNLALVYEAVGKLDEAEQALSEALGLEPENPEILGTLARVRLRQGERGEEVRKLLSDLLLRDSRPEWVEWARSTLATLPEPEKQ